MALLEPSRIGSTSSQQSTPPRPFAPDDFRRERKSTVVQPSSASKASTRTNSRPVPQQLNLHHSYSNSDVFSSFAPSDDAIKAATMRPYEMQRHSMHGSEGGESNGFAKPLVYSSTHLSQQNNDRTPLKEWQSEADKEWQSLRERRRSAGVTPLHVQASLAKSSIMTKSGSTHSLMNSTDEPLQHGLPPRERGRTMDAVNSPSGMATLSRQSPVTALPLSHSMSQWVRDRECSGGVGLQGIDQGSNTTRQARRRSSFDALQRARSIMSITSSKKSSAGESTRELLQTDGNCDESPRQRLRTDEHHQRRGTLHRPSSMHISNHHSFTTAQRPETNNWLSSEERMEQMKRSQKLATMLGGEWLREGGQERGERDAGSSPLKGASTKRATSLLRRQSDPLHLQLAQARRMDPKHGLHSEASVPAVEEERGRTTAGVLRWKTLHTKRSRSSLNLQHDLLVGLSSSPTPIPLSPPPLDINRKAAALLGLCVYPAEHSSLDDQAGRGEGPKTDEQEHKRLSSSSVEMLRDSDSMAADEGQEEQNSGSSVLQPVDTSTAEGEEGRRRSVSSSGSTAAINREERRRRVRKISKWLGAVVPPHLIHPNPDSTTSQRDASGYNLDEAPPSPLTDYMSGSPLPNTERGRAASEGVANGPASSAKPLIKAKAVLNAKLGKRNVESDRASHFSPLPRPEEVGLDGERRGDGWSEREKMANVKRNTKLKSVFGETPPQDLLKASTAAIAGGQRGGRENRRQHCSSVSLPPVGGENGGWQPKRHFRSISPNGLTPSPSQLCFSLDTSRIGDIMPEAASIDSMEEHRASAQYRASIDSLEYLLIKDPPLLNDLFHAIEEDEAASRAALRGCSPVQPAPTAAQATETATTPTTSVPLESPSLARREDGAQNRYKSGSPLHREASAGLDANDSASPLASPTCEGRSSSFEADEAGKTRERRIRRHQKLGRWFGEPLPTKRDLDDNGEEWVGPRTETVTTSSTRMAPRSAGSARRPASLQYHQALGKILNSIEGEMTEDDELTLREKEQLQKRLQKLRSPVLADGDIRDEPWSTDKSTTGRVW